MAFFLILVYLLKPNYKLFHTMNRLFLLFCLTFVSAYEVHAQTTFVLEPSQSMIMTGKGPGQDATINPYQGQDCFAIVENIGDRQFTVRIQQDGKIINEITILKGESKKIKLLKEQELYLDPNPKGTAKASVDYEKIK
ncbi:hypothetical protein SAMN05444394_0870 [Algoriphagus halophilus]|uniref:Uncharacterized protein n=2 Tax=Algoriphagus halophilus TaxID=226505 RepID=A0A1N6DGK3_9BACT|nr:hypothetical protein SAMN05444394_0870 [Algoriphagus halophilus]